MSLRARLLSAIFLALLISFSLSAGLAAWQAVHGVRAELAAALRSARQGTEATLAALPPGAAGEAELLRTVAAFDGSRHLRATLLGPDGKVQAVSRPAPAASVPAWFLSLVQPAFEPVRETVSGIPDTAALVLQSDPGNEAAERWAELRGRMAGFAVFFALSAGLASLVAARSLRPLGALAAGLARIGEGGAAPRLAELGPVETARLAREFNRMAAALAEAQRQNRRLAEQVAEVAEEERAEIARDLHDEIGPLLFAIQSFAAAIGRQVEQGDLAPVPGQVAAIREAAARLQASVREMLGWLGGAAPVAADLPAAIETMLDFWRALRPEIAFGLRVEGDPATLTEAARETLFRVAQEAVSNAVRHGRPLNIRLALSAAPEQATLEIQDDGAGGPEGSGLGLPGMRARLAALDGTLEIRPGNGWRVVARLGAARVRA